MNCIAIRDKIPELVEANNKFLNYLTANTDPFFVQVLNQSLVDAVQTFSQTNKIEYLLDIVAMATTIAEVGGITSEEFSKFLQERIDSLGTYSKRYFFLKKETESNNKNISNNSDLN